LVTVVNFVGVKFGMAVPKTTFRWAFLLLWLFASACGSALAVSRASSLAEENETRPVTEQPHESGQTALKRSRRQSFSPEGVRLQTLCQLPVGGIAIDRIAVISRAICVAAEVDQRNGIGAPLLN